MSHRSERDLVFSAPELQHQSGLEAVQPGLETAYHGGIEKVPVPESRPINGDIYTNGSGLLTPSQRRICGLRLPTFWLSLALMFVVILAAAVGGGVGGTIGRESRPSSSVTGSRSASGTNTAARSDAHTITRTVTSQIAAATTRIAPCPEVNMLNYTSNSTGLTYTQVCNIDISPNESRQNLVNGVFDNFDACIAMCDSYNQWTATTNMNVIIWSFAGTGTAGPQTKGNCWCITAPHGYGNKLVSITGEVGALLVGTFNPSNLP